MQKQWQTNGILQINMKDLLIKIEKEFDKEFAGSTGYCNPTYAKLIKDFYRQSLLQVIERCADRLDGLTKKKEQVNGFQPYHTCDEECELNCKRLRDERKIFFDGFEDDRNLLKIDIHALANEFRDLTNNK